MADFKDAAQIIYGKGAERAEYDRTHPIQPPGAKVATTEGKEEEKEVDEKSLGDILYGNNADAEGESQEEEAKKEVEEPEYKLPEGIEKSAIMDEFNILSEKLGIDKDQSQEIVNLGAKMLTENLRNQVSYWQNKVDSWLSKVKADEEIGGPRYNDSYARSDKLLEEFDQNRELTTFIKSFGLERSPFFIRFLTRVSKALDQVKRPQVSNKDKSAAEILYPHSFLGKQ